MQGVPTADDLDAIWNGGAGTQALGPVINQAAHPSAIGSAEALGGARVNRDIFVSGVSSSLAFGNALVRLRVSVQGIPSAEAFGFPLGPARRLKHPTRVRFDVDGTRDVVMSITGNRSIISDDEG